MIGLPRGLVRLVILNDEIKQTPWLYYILSALLAGLFEEVGRYVVFKRIIPNNDRWSDAIAYGIGHAMTEEVILSHLSDCGVYEAFWGAFEVACGVIFSIAMSVLVFVSVHHADNKKFMYIAVGLHTFMDILGSLLLMHIISFELSIIIIPLFTACVCVYAYRVYKEYDYIQL